MPSTTGIELGADSCVLVSARRAPGACDVVALHILSGDDWARPELALAETLRTIRRSERLPRRARVVNWLADPGAPVASGAAPALRALRSAGFRVRAVLSPVQALTATAISMRRPGGGATAWLALNTTGAAVVIVNGAELLFSQSLGWRFDMGATGLREQLLQRYSLVSHISPVLAYGIATVDRTHGLGVETAVTCGNIPDLRSLTMPLIEEMDLEVEILDSLEGLRPVRSLPPDRLLEAAPAVRLACGAAVAVVPASGGARGARVAAAAAVVAVVAGLGAYAVQRSEVRPFEVPSGVAPEAAVEVLPQTAPAVPPAGPAVSEPAASAEVQESTPVPPVPTSLLDDPPAAVEPPPVRVPTPVVRADRPRPPSASRPAGPPMDAPVPRISAILIGPGRRVAIVDGRTVSQGDAVGPRIIVRIEEDGVVLREPSGLEIKVPLRSRDGPRMSYNSRPFGEGRPGLHSEDLG